MYGQGLAYRLTTKGDIVPRTSDGVLRRVEVRSFVQFLQTLVRGIMQPSAVSRVARVV